MTTLTLPVPALRRAGRKREAAVISVAAALLLALAAWALIRGDYPLTMGDVLRVLAGGGTETEQIVVLGTRLPRLLVAGLAGAAFALAGALMQALLRNPLASPDLLGINGAAAVGAVSASALLGWTGVGVTLAAFGTALAVAAVLLVLARGDHAGYTLIVSGVGIGFVCTATVAYLLKRAQVNLAQSALVWTVGSVNAATWRQVAILGGALIVGVIAVVFLASALSVHRLGAQVAAGLGVATGATRTLTMVLASALAAAAASVVGPVAFVALAAPPIARAFSPGRLALAPAALLGAAMVVGADAVAAGVGVPLGVVTGAVGAPYLLWLLARGRRT